MREEAASSAARAALVPGRRAAAAARAVPRKARRGASETDWVKWREEREREREA